MLLGHWCNNMAVLNQEVIDQYKAKLKKALKKNNLDENLADGVTQYFYVNAIICNWSIKKSIKRLCEIYNLNLEELKK